MRSEGLRDKESRQYETSQIVFKVCPSATKCIAECGLGRPRRKSSASKEPPESVRDEKEASPAAPKRSHPHRQSADAALIAAAFGEPIKSSRADRHRSSSSEPEPLHPPPPVKKRNTMNSRDAAYDPQEIVRSILEPGSGAMRKRGKKKRRESGDTRGEDETEDEGRGHDELGADQEVGDDHPVVEGEDIDGQEGEQTMDVDEEEEAPLARRSKRKRSATVTKAEDDAEEELVKPKKRKRVVTKWSSRGRGKKRRKVTVEVTDEEEDGERERDEAMLPVNEVIVEEPSLEIEAEPAQVEDMQDGERAPDAEDEKRIEMDGGAEDAAAEEVEEEEKKPAPKKRGGARRKGKKVVVDDDDGTGDQPVPKPKGKHPNQYTYRDADGNIIPKSQRTPQKRAGGSSRSKRAISKPGTIEPPFITGLEGWGLPEHLSVLKPILDEAGPQLLSVRSFCEDGKGAETYQVQPSKIRWPTKRNGMGDLKKRKKEEEQGNGLLSESGKGGG
ncbi:hypothetical protein BT69DRAFT_407265 [Atractiella rhizophila]|nr:hypothetical protein BT69DRAFT_407265 [Atractiella rhizophila]